MRARRRSIRLAALGAGIAAALMSITVGSAPAAHAGGPPAGARDAGDAVVVAASNRNEQMSEGDSNTVFSLRLPTGAECPGDSANDDWRVQSFIVPAGTDLATLVYGATRPRGEHMYGLYTTEGAPYVQVLTAQNPAPGQPGQILDPPPLSFAPFTPDLLPLGRYVIGLACSYFERGERYWDTELILTEDRDATPGQRRWQVATSDSPAAAAADTSQGSSPDDGDLFVIGTIVTVAIVVVVAAGSAMRRRRPHQALAKERV